MNFFEIISGIDALDHLTIKFQHKAKRAVRCRLPRSKIDSEISESSASHARLGFV